MYRSICVLAIIGWVALPALAIHPGTEIIVPAAARGQGAGGSVWVTAVTVLNPNDVDVDLSFGWLVRDQANPAPASAARTVEAGSTLVLEDALVDLFGISSGGGAFLVTASQPVVVNAGIFNRAGGEEYGQGFEGIPVTAAIEAGSATHAAGMIENAAYRTNFFLCETMGSGATVRVEVLDVDGAVLGAKGYTLGIHQPLLKNVRDVLDDDVDAGVIRFTVESGAALVGAARVNNGSGDPLTLASWWECGADGGGGDGMAPQSLVGLHLDLVITPIECGMAPFTWDVAIDVLSDTEASISMNGGDPMTILVGTYTVGGDLGLIETSVPDWQITDIWLTMIWSSSSGGRFAGGATDYDGSPIKFTGTFEATPAR
jgi:hypothetical protein